MKKALLVLALLAVPIAFAAPTRQTSLPPFAPTGWAGRVLTITSTGVLDYIAPVVPMALPPTGPASGDLCGTYPAPSACGLNGQAISVAPDGFVKRNSGNTAWEAVGYGTSADTVCQGNDARVVNAVQTSRQVIAGTGLSGGGSLSGNVTLALGTVDNQALTVNGLITAGSGEIKFTGPDSATLGIGNGLVIPTGQFAAWNVWEADGTQQEYVQDASGAHQKFFNWPQVYFTGSLVHAGFLETTNGLRFSSSEGDIYDSNSNPLIKVRTSGVRIESMQQHQFDAGLTISDAGITLTGANGRNTMNVPSGESVAWDVKVDGGRVIYLDTTTSNYMLNLSGLSAGATATFNGHLVANSTVYMDIGTNASPQRIVVDCGEVNCWAIAGGFHNLVYASTSGGTDWLTLAGNVAYGALSAQSRTQTPSGTTATIDWANGTSQLLDLTNATGTTTVTLTHPQENGFYRIEVIEGGTARQVTLSPAPKWVAVPTFASSSKNRIDCQYDGTDYLCEAKTFQ